MQQCARLCVRVNQRGRTVDEVADAEEHVERYRLRSAIDRTNTVGNVLNDAHRSDDPEQRMTEQELVVLMTNVTRKRIERACDRATRNVEPGGEHASLVRPLAEFDRLSRMQNGSG